jgi:eukaryotic-like serine/threonine-protein kinase
VTFEPGQTLAHFRLVDKIGEGGMGEVWRAIDTTLDREVAIKVLPAALSEDPERRARFEREAKLLASLNHPNIAAIYGFPDGEVRFLAMELVRGEDFAQILARGPMPVDEAIDAAKQVASALEAAHDNGVIHRDLKPANVKRTPGRQIKVLDFGLAKALMPAGANVDRSATITSAGSVVGSILGTASYMSPEQARGQTVDRRTDIWAFGCLVYEMLSGAKAFDGATITDVLAAVVTGEPDWEKLPAGVPRSVRRLLRRCLEKDVRKRLRDAGDAALLLDDGKEDAPAPPVAHVPFARSPGFAALALVAMFVFAVGGWWVGRRGSTAAAASSVSFHRLTFSRGMMRSARFAPDGQTIVYGAAWGGPPIKLYLARIESPEATPIALPPGELLSISKTGELAVALGFEYTGWMGDGTLSRTSLLGGSPREILEHVRVADWSPTGSEFAIVRRVDGFDQLEYPVGKVLYKTAGYIGAIRIAPDGERIAFADHPVYSDDRGDLAVVDGSGKKQTLWPDFVSIEGVTWKPGGKEIWFSGTEGDSGSGVYACDLAGNRRVVYSSASRIELLDIAQDGRVLLASHTNERQAEALLAGFPQPRNLIVPAQSSMARAIAPSGRGILVASHLGKEYETFLVRSDRPGAVRLSAGDGVAISPDGSLALVLSADSKALHLCPLGIGEIRTIPNPDAIAYESIPAWLPDGKRFVLAGRHGPEESRAYVVDATSGSAKPFGAPGVFWNDFGQPPVSPDGKFAVLRDKDGKALRWPVDGGAPLPIPGIEPGDLPLTWTADGAALYVGGSSIPIQISRLDLASGRRTAWKTIAPDDPSGLRYVVTTITPDGKYWALSIAKLLTDLYLVDGLR